MSLVVLAGAAHSPGVTSLAVALAVHSREPALLVDANRTPDQSVLAGYLQGVDPAGRGLGAVLQTYRQSRLEPDHLIEWTLPLTGAHEFLPGFAHPGMVSLFGPVWPDFTVLLAALDRFVVVDAGQIGVSGLPTPLVDGADAVLVLTGSRLIDLAALRLYLPQLVTTADPQKVSLVVVGPGRPYRSPEISRRFGLEVSAELPWRPSVASVFAAGEPEPARITRDPYLRAVRQLAAKLCRWSWSAG